MTNRKFILSESAIAEHIAAMKEIETKLLQNIDSIQDEIKRIKDLHYE